ncbi:proteasome lid subunit RPN8/RPN11 [Paenibacillus sp. BK033]|uniref:M67 family metallopeptidase n=1 Tax=Paenibacillus sp. BK033 TaxID=2512133 RepID=UPI001051C1A0|nr:M67 family metallopeptidase [Paenibacillus sp. BK033]TCN01494.1 proteasome lid subunit RPN8/RPN11 [Paenibacillus sp. BK033]
MLSISTISITHQAYGQLLGICREAMPQEACGILAGTPAAPEIPAIVTQAYVITNVHEDPVRSFRFDPAEWVTAYFDIQKNRQSLVGFFHSHPNSSAIPSKRDWLGLPVSDDGISYWIVSMPGSSAADVRPYRLYEQTFRPLALMLT